MADRQSSTLSPAEGKAETPTWSTWREALQVMLYPSFLKKTVRIALIVGTILFAINHLDDVIRGTAGARTLVKGALTYVVPFCVSNYGVLVATRKR